MAHAPFVISAFAIVGVVMSWLIVSSWVAMRKSEALADDLRRDTNGERV